MSATQRTFAAALWLLAAAVAIGGSWGAGAQSGKMTPLALIAFFWGAAAVSMLIHYVPRGAGALRRYRQHKSPASLHASFKLAA